MSVRNDYEADLKLLDGLKMLTTAYEEIAVMRIGRIRGQVLATRTFREGLFEVFAEVRDSRRREIERILKKEEERRKKKGLRNVIQNATGSVAVLVTTDERLSGDIARKVLNRFLSSIDPATQDVVIVGAVGRDYMQKEHPDIPIKYFALSQSDAALAGQKALVAYLRDYEDVSIYFGKFVNVVDQVAAKTDLVGSERLSGISTQSPADRDVTDYLFEPSLQQVVDFFDTQIFAMLLRQTINESSLATLGSRITAMEAASGNVAERYDEVLAQQRRAAREERNQKQRQRLSGVDLW